MSSKDLKPWSYVVLALIGDGGAGAHDMVDMVRRGGRLFYQAAPSQLYAEPKRLAQLGYVDATKEAGRTGERTVYRLTDAGRRALAEWVPLPTQWARIQNEANIKLLAGGFASDGELLASLLALRAELAQLDGLLDEAFANLDNLAPDRRRYLELSFDLGRRLVRAHREWLDDVEARLG